MNFTYHTQTYYVKYIIEVRENRHPRCWDRGDRDERKNKLFVSRVCCLKIWPKLPCHSTLFLVAFARSWKSLTIKSIRDHIGKKEIFYSTLRILPSPISQPTSRDVSLSISQILITQLFNEMSKGVPSAERRNEDGVGPPRVFYSNAFSNDLVCEARAYPKTPPPSPITFSGVTPPFSLPLFVNALANHAKKENPKKNNYWHKKTLRWSFFFSFSESRMIPC